MQRLKRDRDPSLRRKNVGIAYPEAPDRKYLPTFGKKMATFKGYLMGSMGWEYLPTFPLECDHVSPFMDPMGVAFVWRPWGSPQEIVMFSLSWEMWLTNMLFLTEICTK